MAAHRIGREVQTHRRWDVDLEPVLRVQPGDVVTAETDDFAGGQITRTSTAADVAALDLDAIYPLAGPVAIEGAEAGDTISIEILDFELPEWGWACIIPGLGLLPPGEFSEPSIRHFDLTGGVTAELCPGVQIPIEPFCGTMGVPGRRHARRADPAAARGRGQHRQPPPHARRDALPPGRRARRSLLGRRRARRAGRRRGRHLRPRVRDGDDLPRRPAEGRRDPGAADPQARRLAHPARRRRRLVRDLGHRARSDDRRAGRGARDDRAPRARARARAGGRVHALLARGRPQDHRGRGRPELDGVCFLPDAVFVS